MFEFGFYEKEITPPLGCGIPGYFNIRRGCDVLDRLYARAAVIKEGTRRVAILSIDGLHPKTDICDQISRRIEAFTGIPRSHVMIAFTHSHTAIPFRFEGIAFENDPMAADSVKGYIDTFIRLVADCVTLEVPLQCIQIGEFTVYGFNSEIFTEFGKLVKAGDGTGTCLVATLCNDAFGYVPTRDMFFDAIYESRPGSSRLEKEAGYKMARTLLSMKE